VIEALFSRSKSPGFTGKFSGTREEKVNKISFIQILIGQRSKDNNPGGRGRTRGRDLKREKMKKANKAKVIRQSLSPALDLPPISSLS
jgi:hypothetical protein